MAHAENQFVGGDYLDSRATLRRSIDRNEDVDPRYAIPLSDLYRANGTVGEHLGESEIYQRSVLNMRDTLKRGLPASDPRILGAELEVGDSRAKLGFPEEALDKYREVEKKAIVYGAKRAAAYSVLRQAQILQIIGSGIPSWQREARELLDRLANDSDPLIVDIAAAAKVSFARLARAEGDGAATDAVIRDYAMRGGVDRPILLSYDPLKNPEVAPTAFNDGSMARQGSTELSDLWADIGFVISKDGTVGAIEVLRSSGELDWLDPVFDQIKSRRYAPLRITTENADPSHFMIERYSLTARWVKGVTGTRFRRRSLQPRIERIDLTPDNYGVPHPNPA